MMMNSSGITHYPVGLTASPQKFKGLKGFKGRFDTSRLLEIDPDWYIEKFKPVGYTSVCSVETSCVNAMGKYCLRVVYSGGY
jgi:hypothetical protein